MSRAHFAQVLAWHSTLQSAADVTTPDIGGPGSVNGAATFGAGRYGNAGIFTAVGANVTFSSGAGNFDKTRGALEFWYRPNYAHTDGARHVLWQTFGDATHYFVFEKTAGSQLLFSINNGGTLSRGPRRPGRLLLANQRLGPSAGHLGRHGGARGQSGACPGQRGGAYPHESRSLPTATPPCWSGRTTSNPIALGRSPHRV